MPCLGGWQRMLEVLCRCLCQIISGTLALVLRH